MPNSITIRRNPESPESPDSVVDRSIRMSGSGRKGVTKGITNRDEADERIKPHYLDTISDAMVIFATKIYQKICKIWNLI
jgi:hypothetical protein